MNRAQLTEYDLFSNYNTCALTRQVGKRMNNTYKSRQIPPIHKSKILTAPEECFPQMRKFNKKATVKHMLG